MATEASIALREYNRAWRAANPEKCAAYMGYLEARFKLGMKWSNYGKVWEIDHRLPCASFDMTDESHQRSCFHYSNLQPLFVSENRQKHAKLPAVEQAT